MGNTCSGENNGFREDFDFEMVNAQDNELEKNYKVGIHLFRKIDLTLLIPDLPKKLIKNPNFFLKFKGLEMKSLL